MDMSCAFVVCDITQHDLPIVYCSENFERLTGYSKHEILGRNCRFLQAPDGRVQAGVKRKYVDDKSVLSIKNKIAKREEIQLSLINYRKGGQPFMNLLTMIPVQWDNNEYRYYVGFQVDLVEQPGSVAGRNPGEFPFLICSSSDRELIITQMGPTLSIIKEALCPDIYLNHHLLRPRTITSLVRQSDEMKSQQFSALSLKANLNFQKEYGIRSYSRTRMMSSMFYH